MYLAFKYRDPKR